MPGRLEPVQPAAGTWLLAGDLGRVGDAARVDPAVVDLERRLGLRAGDAQPPHHLGSLGHVQHPGQLRPAVAYGQVKAEMMTE